ncbi:hypothetical protein AWC38_SpisGene13305 [Stylophora pistillata]|uniref:Uncharacterized protein n=1 Tax=Stylophora pistillata TaxID=50429 RepID=A0A2B4S0V1_STYPI|nr:hypothetical protein AWC38_SpisGene13305 [Stylophora pistillata]
MKTLCVIVLAAMIFVVASRVRYPKLPESLRREQKTNHKIRMDGREARNFLLKREPGCRQPCFQNCQAENESEGIRSSCKHCCT